MSDSNNDQFNVHKIINFWMIEQWYGSLVMDFLILAFAVYFIINKKWKRFEWTILSCMFVKYTLYAFGTTQTYFDLEK